MISLNNTTAIWVVGALYLILPVNTWIALSGKRSALVNRWCLGGLLGGLGLILIGGRNSLPALLAYNLGHSLFLGLFLLRIHALRCDLGLPGRGRWLWAGALLDALLFALLDAGKHEYLLSIYARAVQTGVASGFVVLAWQLGKREASNHARVIALVYAALALILLARFMQSLDPGFTGIYTSPNNRSGVVAASLVGVLTAIVGHFSFMGLVLQRTLRDQSQAVALRTRQEVMQQQSLQFARMERQHTLTALSDSLAKALNQPLTSILQQAELAQRSLQGGALDADLLIRQSKGIVDAVQRTSELIRRIRSLIQPHPPRHEEINLQQLLDEAWELVRHAAMAERVEVSLPNPEPRIMVLGDPVQLSQVLLSVLHNAVKAMAGARLRQLNVALETSGARVRLTVQDTGPGLPPEVLALATAPAAAFWAGESGMSLSIARHIVMQHRGDLRFGNAAKGGAVVEIELPVATAAAPARPAPAADSSAGSTASPVFAPGQPATTLP